MEKHLIREGKTRTVYKIHVEANVELDEELFIEADDEDDALNEAETEGYDMLDDIDIFTEVLGVEVVEDPAVYEYELEPGEYTITSAELIDYDIVRNSREFIEAFHPGSSGRAPIHQPENRDYLFTTPGGGVGILNSDEVNIYGALDREGYIIPCISISLSDEFSAQDQKDIMAGPKLTLNGKTFCRIEIETEGKFCYIPKEPIGKCAFRKEISAEDASSYAASDVKKMIDEWAEGLI